MKLRLRMDKGSDRKIQVGITGFKGHVKIRYFRGQKVIHEKDCDDPPCHEVVSFGPAFPAGVIRVVAEDINDREVAQFDVPAATGGLNIGQVETDYSVAPPKNSSSKSEA